MKRMRENARQIKVQEKLKQMSDITWYEEFLHMLPDDVARANHGSKQALDSRVEDRLLVRIKG